MRCILILFFWPVLAFAEEGPAACPSDLNGDGYCRNDTEILQAALGSCQKDPSYDSRADLNGDGCVNGKDEVLFTDRRIPHADTCLADINRDRYCDYRDLLLLYKSIGLCKDHRHYLRTADANKDWCVDKEDQETFFPMFMSKGAYQCDLDGDGECRSDDYKIFREHSKFRPEFAGVYSEHYLPSADANRDGFLHGDKIRLFGLADDEETHKLAQELRSLLKRNMKEGNYLEDEGSVEHLFGNSGVRLAARARSNLQRFGAKIFEHDGWGYSAEENFLLTLLGREGDIIISCRLFNNLVRSGNIHESDKDMLCPYVR